MLIDFTYVSYGIMILFATVVIYGALYKQSLYRKFDNNGILCVFKTHRRNTVYIVCPTDGQTVIDAKYTGDKKRYKNIFKPELTPYAGWGGYIFDWSRVFYEQYPNKPIINWLSVRAPACMWGEGNAEPIMVFTKSENEEDKKPVITNKMMYALRDTATMQGKAQAAVAVNEAVKEQTETLREAHKIQKPKGGNSTVIILVVIGIIALCVIGYFVYMRFKAVGIM